MGLIQAKLTALKTLTSATGQHNELEWKWLSDLNSDTTLTLEGQWLKYLSGLGYTGTVDEMKIASWKALGYSGTFNELEEQFWAGGGSYSSVDLTTDLVSWWTLDETSGTRADSHGSNDLTDGTTTGFATGKQGNAADFDSDYLTTGTSTGINSGANDWSVALWVYLDTNTADDYLVGFGQAGAVYSNANGYNWIIITESSQGDRVTVEVGHDGLGWAAASATGTNATGAWNFIYAQYDSTSRKVGISANGGTLTEQSLPELVAPREYATSYLRLGANNTGGSFLDGKLDEVAVWNRLLTDEEIQTLWNSGAGIGYPG